jgi:hypothetical protein
MLLPDSNYLLFALTFAFCSPIIAMKEVGQKVALHREPGGEVEVELINPSRTEVSYWESRAAESCPLCGGTGFQLVELQGQAKARKCRCISPERINALRMRSRIPYADWKESLEKIQPRSLQGICLVDFLKGFLNQRDIPLLQVWIASTEPPARRVLVGFANDLIQLRGYSCLWMNCLTLGRQPMRFRSQKRRRPKQAGLEEDFVFIENYRNGLLSHRQQGELEEILWERFRAQKSTFFLGPSPGELAECGNLFSDEQLSRMILKKFRLVEPATAQEPAEISRWLF